MARMLTADALARSGYRVVTASDGEEALNKASEPNARFDLLLTDFLLPLVNGLELARLLRDRFPKLPVVYMSGHAAETLREEADGEIRRFLQKPFTLAELARSIRQALDEANSVD